MRKKILIFVSIILLLIIYYFKSKNILNENFDISPENSFSVNENKLEIHKKMDDDKNKYLNQLKDIWNNPQGLKTVNKISANEFKLKGILEEVVKESLNNRIDNKIVVGEIENIGWYNEELEKRIVFNFDILIINRQEIWIIPVKVWVILDIKDICDVTEGCINIISQDLENNLIGVDDIKPRLKLEFIQEDDTRKYIVKPREYVTEYFRIKNKLFLTEPFLTSREEMRL